MSQHYTILLISDDEAEKSSIKTLLSALTQTNFHGITANNADEGFAICLKIPISCILVDYRLPNVDGVEFIKKLSHKLNKNLPPIILLINSTDDAAAISAMKIGALDYLYKDNLTALRLEKTIMISISHHQLEKSLRKHNEELSKIALSDSLTNLPNRRAFESALNSFFHSAIRYNRLSALLFFDVDNFKKINDTLGHPIGDLLLKEIGERIKTLIRSGDIAARLGGDEFAIILNEISSTHEAGIVANKLRQISAQPFFLKQHQLYITLSVGIVCFPCEVLSVEDLLKYADIAMYHAKQAGGDGYQYYEKNIHIHYQHHLKLEQQIHDSIKNGEIYLVYQPIVDLRTKKIIGLEALARWDSHFFDKIILPEEFIPIAESNGFIYELGTWVTQSAHAQLAQWQKQYNFNGYLSLNLSTAQLGSYDFLSNLLEFLDGHNSLDKTRIELTENAVIHASRKIKELFQSKNHAAIKIHIDDFGANYSSLRQLKELPITTLSIDRFFVQQIGNENNDLIIKAIIAIAKELKFNVVAEGIETEQQRDFLVNAGCFEGQGYYFYPPLSITDVNNLLTKQL
jgi:diguanylate cyclase (GGDEF)-like protein